MNPKKSINMLRKRAEELLAKPHSNIADNSIYQLLNELNIHQIELELQNDNLIKMHAELQASHQKYADLYDLAPIAYFTLNKDGLIIDVNQSGLALIGMKKSMLINRCFSTYITPDYQFFFSQFRHGITRNQISQSCELKLQRWSGPAFDAHIECKLIGATPTKDEQFLLCITDITLRKARDFSIHLQRAKIASIDRMRSINEQVYSLSREQNRCLTVLENYINGGIRRLESKKYDADELLQTLKKILLQTSELSNNTSQLKNLSSKSILRYEITDINSAIVDTLSLLTYETPEFSIAMRYDPAEPLPSVKIDKLHIQQVILSLARNSIEAMKDANTIQPKILIETRLLNPNEVAICLFDNGPGFEQAIANKIFDPHFSTKSYAVGLGLSTSRTIIEKHGGHLTAGINSSGGANFQFTLPCAHIAAAQFGQASATT